MEYYNPNDNRSKRYAAIALIVVLVVFVSILSFVSISVEPSPPRDLMISVDVTASNEEPEEIEREEEKKEKKEVIQNVAKGDERVKERVDKPSPANTKPAEEPKSEAVNGKAEETQTKNPHASFDPSLALSTERVSAGSRSAEEADEETRNGGGSGQDLEGTDNLSQGLQNRGLREALPKPAKTYNVAGKIIVRARVDKLGNVVHAEYSLGGSTTQDSTLMKLAIEAALKAKFVESDHEDEGTILYNFELD